LKFSFAGQPPQPTPVPEQMPPHQLETGKAGAITRKLIFCSGNRKAQSR
jgi:hypothetical protein